MRQRPKVIAAVAEMLWRTEGTKQNKKQQIVRQDLTTPNDSKNTSRKRGVFCLLLIKFNSIVCF